MDAPVADINEVSKTRDRIILEATILFARHGYAAVSVRDIAAQVNIKAASIYSHFASKEVLFDAILDNVKDIYLDYYARVEKKIEKANGFAEVLEYLFAELKEVYQIFIFYGISLIIAEQFHYAKANDILNNVLMKTGIDYSKSKFDMCVSQNWVKDFDTRALAIFFMNSVLMGTLIRTHEDMQHKTAYDAAEMFRSLQHYMLNSVEIIGPR